MAEAKLDGRSLVRRRAGLRLWLSAGWLMVLCVVALLAPWIAPKDPLAQDLFLGRLPPFWVQGTEPGYYLGTDSLGRDVLSRILHGARLALTVALVAGTITCLIGATLGLMAGFLRGWVDMVISRLIDIWMAFPPVLFSILLIAVLGPGLLSIIIAIVVIDWTRFARVVRAEAMAQGAMDYVASARVAGRGRIGTMLREILPNVLPTIVVLHWTRFARVVRAEAMAQGAMDYVASARVVGRERMGTMLREILPNVLPTIVVLLTLEMGIAVIVEAILSFVNLSISTDDPTWGGMIAEGRTSVHQAWWVLVFPLVTLFLTVLAFSQLGEGLKDRFDPVLR